MLKELLNILFGKKETFQETVKPEASKGVKQTGLIVEAPKPGQWIGEETGIVGAVRMPDGDWSRHLPVGEKQYATLGFDSMSCTTFSALNLLETFLKYLMPSLPEEHKDFLKRFGFISELGEPNCSDNFTAIMSGTTRNGNTFPKVWESIRTQGILSEKNFPFSGDTFDQFHDPKRITDYMKRRAKKFLDFFTVQYSWNHFTNTGTENTAAEIQAMKTALKESPLHIAIVIPATHAEMLVNYGDVNKTFFDSYDPFIKPIPVEYNPIHFSMKAVLIPKLNAPKFPIPAERFSMTLKNGMTNSQVLALQKILSYFGFMNVATGFFGPVTVAAVKEFQAYHGLEAVGEVGPKTRALLNNMCFPEVSKTNAEILYETAFKNLNKDVTPLDKEPDELACAASVNAIHRLAFGSDIGGGASTTLLYEALINSQGFFKVTTPEPGDIVISPTGYGKNQAMPNGHTGIVGKANVIMSNSSSNGKFSENFTMASWRQRYVDQGGYPMIFFRKR